MRRVGIISWAVSGDESAPKWLGRVEMRLEMFEVIVAPVPLNWALALLGRTLAWLRVGLRPTQRQREQGEKLRQAYEAGRREGLRLGYDKNRVAQRIVADVGEFLIQSLESK